MDGKGRWMNDVFIERLWRSLKYERIRLYSYGTGGELKAHVAEWMSYHTPQADVSLTTPAPLPNKPPQNNQPPSTTNQRIYWQR
jgi:putative transposase